jgi:hypothetical protein
MFANQRRGSAGLGAIVAVGIVVASWLVGTGLLVKAYRDGGTDSLRSQCELVCRGAEKGVAST